MSRYRLDHLELRGAKYHARLNVPAKAQARLGKRKFRTALDTADRIVAKRRAAPLIATWQRQIAEALGRESAVQDDAAFFQRALRNATSDAERETIKDIVWGKAYDVGLAHTGDVGPMGAPEAAEFYGRATAVPFADFLVEWQATSPTTAKTSAMYAADVRRFAARFPTVESVTKPEVKRWASALMEEGLRGNTVGRILGALRGYWRHLQSVGVAPEGSEPFTGLNIATKGGRVSREDRRKAFTPDDVMRLLGATREIGDYELADLITLAMYSGARIEELCALKVEVVRLTSKVPHFTIAAGKSDAAIREVPIHMKLAPVLHRLIGKRADGYVLAALTPNKYGDRSNAIGKRFGRLKAKMGYGPDYVFHSVRKCVATLFKDASVPEFVAADILGHEIATLSYGLYAGDVSLATKARAIAKLRY